MSDVNLTSGIRSNLLQLQHNAALRQQVADRLSTGSKVRRVSDAPTDFFTVKAISNRVGDLTEAKGRIGQALSSVKAGQVGATAIEDLTRQLKGIALSVRGGSAEERQAAAQQFDALRGQIDSLATDASYQGRSLLGSPPSSVDTRVGDLSQATITVGGRDSTVSGLSIGTAASDFGNFATDTDINNAVAGIDSAINTLRGTQSQFSGGISGLSIREDFTTNLTNTLQSGAGKLSDANLNEEAAKQLSLQLRDRIGLAGLRFATQTEGLIAQIIKS